MALLATQPHGPQLHLPLHLHGFQLASLSKSPPLFVLCNLFYNSAAFPLCCCCGWHAWCLQMPDLPSWQHSFERALSAQRACMVEALQLTLAQSTASMVEMRYVAKVWPFTGCRQALRCMLQPLMGLNFLNIRALMHRLWVPYPGSGVHVYTSIWCACIQYESIWP